MRKCRCTRKRKTRDNREYCRKCDSRQEPKEEVSAKCFRKQRTGHVAALVNAHNDLLADEYCCAESDCHREDVKIADKPCCIEDRFSCRLSVRHRIKPHQNVRQTCCAEHKSQTE